MSNKMWGGRFSSSPDAIMEEINASIDVDRHLYRQDIAALTWMGPATREKALAKLENPSQSARPAWGATRRRASQ